MLVRKSRIFRIPMSAVLIFIVICSSVYASETIVIYPRFQSESDSGYNDLIELLKPALDRTVPEYGKYRLKSSDIIMSELRAIQEIKTGSSHTGINLIYRSTTIEMEKTLLPIRIPLRKGLLGYWIFLIRQEDRDTFTHITNIEDLKKLSAGQGGDWGDVKVFEANGFKVTTAWSYESLFTLLSNRGFDYFSRGINEAYPEYEMRKGKYPNLQVEQSLLLYYPWPYYFFVSRNNPELAKRVEKGLMMMMIDDGTFDLIFFKYHQDAIRKADIGKRKVFILSNPLLPPETPLENKRLWNIPGLPDIINKSSK